MYQVPNTSYGTGISTGTSVGTSTSTMQYLAGALAAMQLPPTPSVAIIFFSLPPSPPRLQILQICSTLKLINRHHRGQQMMQDRERQNDEEEDGRSQGRGSRRQLPKAEQGDGWIINGEKLS